MVVSSVWECLSEASEREGGEMSAYNVANSRPKDINDFRLLIEGLGAVEEDTRAPVNDEERYHCQLKLL